MRCQNCDEKISHRLSFICCVCANEILCDVCVKKGNYLMCIKCNNYICHQCNQKSYSIDICSKCINKICIGCIQYCQICKLSICSEYKRCLNNCGRRICFDCLKKVNCQVCDRSVCLVCYNQYDYTRCKNCNLRLCKMCSGECHICLPF